MVNKMGAWEKPIDSGEITDSNTHFDVIAIGGGPVVLPLSHITHSFKVLQLEKET